LLIIEQNNYSNTYLKAIGEKLNKIENKVDPIKPTSKTFDIEKPLFTSHEILLKLKISFKIKKKIILTLLEEISKRL
jgi:hypothetical protein